MVGRGYCFPGGVDDDAKVMLKCAQNNTTLVVALIG